MTTPQTEQAVVLSKNPNVAMQEMMNTIDVLKDVYKRETVALEQADTRAFLSMQNEKLQAARAYQDGIGQILQRREEMKKANPLLKKRLEDMQKDFATLSMKNMDALQRMARVSERLGNTIRVAAKDAAVKKRTFSYGENGTMKSTEKKTVSMGVSETA